MRRAVDLAEKNRVTNNKQQVHETHNDESQTMYKNSGYDMTDDAVCSYNNLEVSCDIGRTLCMNHRTLFFSTSRLPPETGSKHNLSSLANITHQTSASQPDQM